jgi:hypothetical protein
MQDKYDQRLLEDLCQKKKLAKSKTRKGGLSKNERLGGLKTRKGGPGKN